MKNLIKYEHSLYKFDKSISLLNSGKTKECLSTLSEGYEILRTAYLGQKRRELQSYVEKIVNLIRNNKNEKAIRYINDLIAIVEDIEVEQMKRTLI